MATNPKNVEAEQAKGAVREVARKIRGMPTSDGAGVRLHARDRPAARSTRSIRSCCSTSSARTTPSDYIGGFPDHPHRGFETVTYMLAGRMRHGDNQGNSGLLGPGGVQWMTAGKGIVHSEMPEQKDGLHVGLPALGEPAGEGQDHEAALSGHPGRPGSGGRARPPARAARVLVGTVNGVKGPVDGGRDRAGVLRFASRAGRVRTPRRCPRGTTRSRTCIKATRRSARRRPASSAGDRGAHARREPAGDGGASRARG